MSEQTDPRIVHVASELNVPLGPEVENDGNLEYVIDVIAAVDYANEMVAARQAPEPLDSLAKHRCDECGHLRNDHDWPGTKASPACCLNEGCACCEFEEPISGEAPEPLGEVTR